MPQSSLTPRERRGLIALTVILICATLLLSVRRCDTASVTPRETADTLVVTVDTAVQPVRSERVRRLRRAKSQKRRTPPPSYRSPLDERVDE